jgi:transmembrane sensor
MIQTKRPPSKSPGARPVRKLVGFALLFSLMVTHLAGDATHRLPSAAARTPSAHSLAQATHQTFCPGQTNHALLVDRKSIHLPDGTIVELNADACFHEDFSTKERSVKLDFGEAIFRVAPDARRPFTVTSGPIQIRVLGTTFDVYRKESGTRVSVGEGAVQISSADSTSRPNVKPLIGMQQMDVPDAATEPRIRRPITSEDLKRITAWLHGDIEFTDEPLQDVLNEFRRYLNQPVKVIFDDSRIARVRFTGVFHTANLKDFLGLLPGKCIHGDFDEPQQQITLTFDPGQPGTHCPKL